MRYSEVEKANTNLMWFYRSNISCVRLREKGRNFITTLEEYNEKLTPLTKKITSSLMAA